MNYLSEDSAIGCEGLIYNIDEIKKQCETYQDKMFFEKGEQMRYE